MMSQHPSSAVVAAISWLSMVVAGLTGCRSPSYQAQDPTGPHFSLATYNIYYKSKRPDLTCAVIEGSGADVVVLQEITPSLAAFIQSSLQDRYPYMRFRMDRFGGGLGVISRFQFQDVAIVPSPVNDYDSWLFTAATPIGHLEILTVHLDPDVNTCDEFSPIAYLKGRRRRLVEIKVFAPYMRPDGLRVIAGDFNEDDKGSGVEFLEANGFTDALPMYDRWSRTWALWWPVPLISARLDHILYAKPLQCYDARVLGHGGSDHRAIMASFTVARATQAAGMQEAGAASTEPRRHASDNASLPSP
jgi:endonuclease/exonuclease/phosphatase (EEP) superfamily protein YafD